MVIIQVWFKCVFQLTLLSLVATLKHYSQPQCHRSHTNLRHINTGSDYDLRPFNIAATLDGITIRVQLHLIGIIRNEWVLLPLQGQQINRRRWWLVRSTRCEGNDWNKTTGSWWCFLSQTARWRPTALFLNIPFFCFVTSFACIEKSSRSQWNQQRKDRLKDFPQLGSHSLRPRPMSDIVITVQWSIKTLVTHH